VHGSSSTTGSPCDSSVQSHKCANHTGFPNERTDGNGYPNGHTAAAGAHRAANRYAADVQRAAGRAHKPTANRRATD